MTLTTGMQGSALARIMARAKAELEWAAQNPELAAAWDEARDEDEQRKIARERQRWEQALLRSIHARLPDMGVPRRLADAVEAEMLVAAEQRRWWETRAMQAARRYVGERKTFLLMLGGAGAGKSAAASWVLTHARTRLYEEWEIEIEPSRGMFVRSAEAARIPRFDDQEDLWRRMLNVQWLVLDDLGIETMSDFWSERVNELLDARYGNRRRTVLTSNLEVEPFKARYGDRIVSRLREDSIIVDVGNEDCRKAATA